MSSRDDDHSTSTKSFFVTIYDEDFSNSNLSSVSSKDELFSWFQQHKRRINLQLECDFPGKVITWSCVAQFGIDGDHLHLHLIVNFDKCVKLGSVSDSFCRLYSDVCVKKIGNIANLCMYLLSEEGAIVVKSFSCVDFTGSANLLNDDISENGSSIDLGEGKMTFRKIVCARLHQEPDANTRKLKRELMTKYPHMFSQTVFDEMVANHRALQCLNAEDTLQQNCSKKALLKLFHFLDLQNECKERNLLIEEFMKMTQKRRKHDKHSCLLWGETGAGKTWCTDWLHHGNTGLVNMSVEGSGKFVAVANHDIVIFDEMPKNMKLWQKDRGGSATMLQLLHGDSTSIKVPGTLIQISHPPWALIISNYWEPEYITPEMKRRIKVFKIRDVGQWTKRIESSEYPLKYSGRPFPFETYNREKVWEYFAQSYEHFKENKTFPCFCILNGHTPCTYYNNFHLLCKNVCNNFYIH